MAKKPKRHPGSEEEDEIYNESGIAKDEDVDPSETEELGEDDDEFGLGDDDDDEEDDADDEEEY